jgi:ferric-dicitrate binding protein FerR (iron transport regulator)
MSQDRISSPPRLAQTSDEMAHWLTSAEAGYRQNLDEARAWERLQSRLSTSAWGSHAGVSRRRGRAVYAVLAAAAVMALTWFGWNQHHQRTVAADARAALAPDATVAPLVDSSIRLAPGKSQLPDGTLVELTENAQGTMVTDKHRSTLKFERGRLDIQVAHQSPGRTFAVKTRDVEFVVLGTRFSVVTREKQVDLNVSEGRVLVNTVNGGSTIVRAGGHWSNQPETIPEIATSATANVKADAHPEQDVTRATKVSEISMCRDHVRDGKPRVAEQCYLEVANGKGLSAEMALYEVARLRRDVLSNPSGSLAALDEHDARFPTGTLTPEVRIARVDLLSRLGRSDEALQVSAQELATSIGRAREAELRLLRGNLLRDQKQDCAAAIAEYQQIESDPGPRGDQAQFAKAGCLRRLGKKSEAIDAYTHYLQRSRPAQAERARQYVEELTQ